MTCLAAMDVLIGVSAAGAVAVLIVAGILIGRQRWAARIAALRDAAGQLGLVFAQDGDRVLGEAFARFPLFSAGRHRQASGVLSGRLRGAGQEIHVFEYSYTTGSGKSRHTHRQTVIALRLPGADLPLFTLHPENILHRIASAFGYQDIDFESASEFSRNWLLRGPDEVAIRVRFSPRLVQALQDERGICIEGGNEWLVFYRQRQRIAPRELAEFVERSRGIAAAFARR